MKSFQLSVLLLFTFILNSPVFSQKKLSTPSVFHSLIQSLGPEMSWQDQYKNIKEWLKDHGNINFPYITKNTVTFIYFDRSPEYDNCDKVNLSWPGNKWNTGTTLLENVYNGPLHLITLRLRAPYITTYSLITTRDSSQKAILDPLNPWIKDKEYSINIVPSPYWNGSIHKWADIQPRTKIYPLSSRNIWVYLPPAYHDNPDKHYPVLYMQDGRSIWNNGGWLVNGHADRLIHEGRIQEIIIVGIENSHKRSEEYVGFSTLYKINLESYDQTSALHYKKKAISRNQAYVDFLINEVKALIDQNYRTIPDREHTAIAGSSYGAGISLHIGLKYTNIFSMVGSLSGGNVPAEWIQQGHYPFMVFPYIINKQLPDTPSQKVYLHCGDQDAFMPATRLMYDAMLEHGWVEGKDLLYIEDYGQGHTKSAWAARMPEMLTWFFGI